MKKLLTLLLAALLAVGCLTGLTACGKKEEESVGEVVMPAYVNEDAAKFDNTTISSDFKLGVICLHDQNSTYDNNFLEAVERARVALGLQKSQVIIKTNIAEDANCYEAAKALANQGCKAIFADSFGHEDHIVRAAQEFRNVQFFHATGVKAHTLGLTNYHNGFASIYEGRYLAGYAAGMKLMTMTDKAIDKNFKVGYVGAWPYAEVKSGYTSWFLGLQAALTDGYTATMEVKFTNSWYDEVLEKTAAETLIQRGAVLISQHADSWGAPNACEAAGVPNVSYNGSTIEACPETFIISSKIDWTYYFKWIIASVGGSADAVVTDYAGGIKDGLMVVLTNANGDVIADGTIEKLVEVRNKIVSGEIKVFDCSKFTVDGQHLTSYNADVDGDYIGETNVIKTEGDVTYFDESNSTDFRSAPYFDIDIDGITIIN